MENGNSNGSSRRTFLVIRLAILNSLSKGQQTINQIATITGINWRTVELHLTFLVGKGFAKEIFNSQYVRIFSITDLGAESLNRKLKRIHDRVVIRKEENAGQMEELVS